MIASLQLFLNYYVQNTILLDPPAITVSLANFTLRCGAEREPMNVSYVSWTHFSDRGSFVRSFSGSEYLTLNSTYKRCMLNGQYVCEATNGISDTAGNIKQSGNHSVQFESKWF